MSKEQGSPPELSGLGWVAGAHGLRGALKVRADRGAAATAPEVFTALAEVVIGGKSFPVMEARRLKGQVLLILNGVSNRDQAEELVGQEVKGDRQRFPALPPGEYYWFQLLGLPVIDARDGAVLGQITEIIPTPGHDVLVVRRGSREILFPAVEEVIVEVNVAAGFIRVSPPPGLLEIYAD